MMQNGRINSPKLRPRLSSSEKPKSKNMPTCLEIEVVEYRVPAKPLRFELWGAREDLPPTDPRPNALL